MKAPRSKPEHTFNEFASRRLVSYVTAAAASAGLLGVSPTAEAKVVYTPAHVVISTHTGYPLDLANSGTTDFVIHGSLTANCSTVFSALLLKPVIGNAVEGMVLNESNLADALKAGSPIGSSQRFLGNDRRGGILMGEVINSPGGGQYRGNWVHVVSRYLGLKFQINGETHYGWARLSVTMSLHRPLESVLSGYAYETLPNTPITAGQEKGQSLPIGPAINGDVGSDASLAIPASLGVLALGAQGLPLWRREQPGATA